MMYGSELQLDYLRLRETGQDPLSRIKQENDFVNPLQGRTRWKKLRGHCGCVNALCFSQSGKWLISGGDDSRIMGWNADVAAYIECDPKHDYVMEAKHDSNVFCLDTDAQETRIFSGGNDWKVLVHDMVTGKPKGIYLHEDAVYGLGVSPETPEVFATACSDGRTQIFDLRVPLPPPDQDGAIIMAESETKKPFLSAQFNPMDARLLLTSCQDRNYGASLWDVRKPKIPLVIYSKFTPRQTAMFARFNNSGSKVLALCRRHCPAVYNLQNTSTPVLFDAPGYYNNCTMKSACFAGLNDEYILAGSDDFVLYAWEIPGEERTYVARPDLALRGHLSVVNQVRCRESDGLIASSGVEKAISLWSGVLLPGSSDTPSRDVHERAIFQSRFAEPMDLFDSNTVDENPRMLAFFDRLIEHERPTSSSSVESESEFNDTIEEQLIHNTSSATSSNEDARPSSRNIEDIILRKRKFLNKKRQKKLKRIRPLNETIAKSIRRNDSSDSSSSTSTVNSSLSSDEDTAKPALGNSTSDSSGDENEPSTSAQLQKPAVNKEILASLKENLEQDHQEDCQENKPRFKKGGGAIKGKRNYRKTFEDAKDTDNDSCEENG